MLRLTSPERRAPVAALAALLRRTLWCVLLTPLALVAVRAQVSITTQPQVTTVTAGQPATFTVTATGNNLTYQWRRNSYSIPGATRSSYTIAAASQGDADLYDVMVTGGSLVVTTQSARLWVTPTSYPGAIEVDLSRSLRLEGPDNGQLTAQAALPDGRFYIAGNFKTVGGAPLHDIVRFNANGTVDPTFTPPTFDQGPNSIAIQTDGKLLIGGFFSSVGGVPTGGIVRLNPDGSRDNTFAVGSGFAFGVQNVFVTPGGSVYVTGGLGSYQGGASISYIARLTSTGLLDTSFTPPSFSTNGIGTNPLGFAFGPSGEIYVHGLFDKVNDVTRNRLARLLNSGAVDPSFNPGTGPNSFVYAMLVLSTGQIVIGGDFTAYNGTPVGRIARLNPSGALDTSFATGTGFSSQVNFLVELPGNNLFVSSIASTFKGVFVPQGARITPTGNLDTSFNYTLFTRPDALAVLTGGRMLVMGANLDGISRPTVRILEANGTVSGFSAPAFRFAGRARMLAHLSGGKILVAGDFSHVNGVPAPYVMRLNADLSRDTSFPNGPGPASQVTTGVVQPDGKILLLLLDGMIRLNADGSRDSTFSAQPPTGFWSPSPPVVLQDGRIFVPTTSPSWGSGPPPSGFVLLEANGTRVLNHPMLPGPATGANTFGPNVTGAQLLPSGQLLVAGSFTSWNGVNKAKVVRLNANGTVDTAFTFDSSFYSTNSGVYLTRTGPSVQRDERLIAMSNNQPVAMGRFNANGARDSGYPGVIPSMFDAGRMVMQADEKVLVSGQTAVNFFNPGLSSVFFRVTRDGQIDPTFSLSGSTVWHEALIADNGELLTSDGSGYLHRYRALPAPVISVQPASQSVTAGATVTLAVTAAGQPPLTYQWSRNGVALIGATNAAFILDNVLTSAAGSYTVTVSSTAGSVTSNPATLAVTARSSTGVYFGSLGGTAGSFSLLVRPDGTGVFLGYARNARIVLVQREVVVAADRTFRFTATGTTVAGSESTHLVEGTVSTDGSVSGNIPSLGLTLSALTPSPGSTPELAGFYQAGASGNSATTYLLAGAAGAAYVVRLGGGSADAGFGAIDAEGRLNVTTENNARFTGTIQSGEGTSALIFTPAAGPAIAFSGVNVDTRSNVEKLVNISTRSQVGGSAGTFTVGFYVVGDQPKPVLLRAIGPTLSQFGLAGALSAARLEVFRGTTSLAVGNDWGAASNATGIAATAVRVGAFALPATSRDAALLLLLEPGAYSATVSGQGNAAGVALVEVYDATEGIIPRSQRIINLSTLALAGAGDNVLAAGFFVSGTVPKRLLVRGAGPALTQFGLSGVLARPQVAIFSGSTQLLQNSGWSTSPDASAIAQAAAQVGAFAFPAGSQDAALIVYLAPGSYSAQVSGVGGTTGTALVEIYELP